MELNKPLIIPAKDSTKLLRNSSLHNGGFSSRDLFEGIGSYRVNDSIQEFKPFKQRGPNRIGVFSSVVDWKIQLWR